jgi:hypothetical protein
MGAITPKQKKKKKKKGGRRLPQGSEKKHQGKNHKLKHKHKHSA